MVSPQLNIDSRVLNVNDYILGVIFFYSKWFVHISMVIIFSGVTIYTPTYVLNQSEVVIMFDNGAGVEVVDNQGFMTARVYLPWSFIVSTFLYKLYLKTFKRRFIIY